MRRFVLFRDVLLCTTIVTAAGCGDGPGITDPFALVPATTIQLQSDAGDYIGAGRTYSYTQADAIIGVQAEGGLLRVHVDGDEWWSGAFQLPAEMSRLQPGSYRNLQRYPFHDDEVGGLSWSGDGRGCNMLTGEFTIDHVVYDGNDLAAVVLRFEQRCGSAGAALRGTIHWRFDDPTAPAGPVRPIPSSLWRPASTPASDSYIFLASDAGDYIGQGRTYTYGKHQFTVQASNERVTIRVNEPEWWYGDFQAMNSIHQLRTGYYGDLRRFPFHNPVKGGLDWSGDGRGCNELTGWFAIDQIVYTNGAISVLELRFEQHCEGAGPALRGAIRWTQ